MRFTLPSGALAALLTLVPLASLAPGAAAAPAALADDPRDGFGVTNLSYPGQSVTATLSGNRIVSFDGLTVQLWLEDDIFLATWCTLPSAVFPSFLIVSADEDWVVFGESTNGTIYTLETTPTTPTAVAQLNFNYDAVYEDEDHVLVSAADRGFGNGNQIYRVNLMSGTTTLLAQVSGASGPMALDPAGGLYYGTSSALFPAPAGSSDILHWTASQLTGQPVVGEAEATLVQGGFDGAGSLVLDPDTGSLYLAENNFDLGVNRIRRVPGSGSQYVLLEGRPGHTIGNLEWEPGDGVAAFHDYQPASGGTVRYNTTDFFSTWERNAIRPARPALDLSGVGTGGPGPFDLTCDDGAPNGFAIVFYGPSALAPAVEVALPHGAFPIFLGLHAGSMARVPGTLPFDANGFTQRTYVNPGGLEGQFALQLLVFDASGSVVGSSSVSNL